MVKRLLLSALSLGTAATMMAQANFFAIPCEVDGDGYFTNGGYLALAISHNGRYVCGSSQAMQGFVYDLEAQKLTSIEPIDDEGCEYRHISNSGLAVGFNGPATALNATTGLESVVWANTDTYATLAEDVTDDGEYIVGEIANYDMTKDNAWQTKGVVWHAGEMTILPCPTSEEMGFEVSGTKARFISEDGSVIVGSVIDNMSTYPVVAWRRQADGSYLLDPICKGKFCDDAWDGEGPYFAMVPGGLSANGRYVSLGVEEYLGKTKMSDGSTMAQSASRIARLDLQTGEITTFPYRSYTVDTDGKEQIADIPCDASGISNDGTILGYAVVDRLSYTGLIVPSETDSAELLSDAFPEVEAFQIYDMTGMSRPVSITADGRQFTGFGISENGFQSYVLTRPETDDAIAAPEAKASQARRFYSLDGRALQAPTRGLYIETNGKNSRKILKR